MCVRGGAQQCDVRLLEEGTGECARACISRTLSTWCIPCSCWQVAATVGVVLRRARIAASCVDQPHSQNRRHTAAVSFALSSRLTPDPLCDPLHSPSYVTQAGKNINRAAEDAKDSASDAYDSTKKAVRYGAASPLHAWTSPGDNSSPSRLCRGGGATTMQFRWHHCCVL